MAINLSTLLNQTSQIQLCKAWVNFNGTTGTPSIRASYNVSSITKIATGDYMANFTTAMTDINFVLSGTAGHISGTKVAVYGDTSNANPVTTSVTFSVSDSGGGASLLDAPYVMISVFGN